ncbi:MAG: phosphoribosylglycinamide formyltransferase [Gammaproteobacteria bacterium]|nr:phosphoribosylglycinamide formyltransferase [Gammaproteobacteria bacterium]
MTTNSNSPLAIVVLISGKGSNLQALIDHQQQFGDFQIVAVISNRGDAAGLHKAQQAGIATRVLDHKLFNSRDEYDQALIQLIDDFNPGLVVLAGFMRIFSAAFVQHYAARMLNIHPSLLPAYRGLNTHQRALDDKAREHGASVHFVTEELDGGPVVAQAKVLLDKKDNAKSLANKVHSAEHQLYPLCVQWFAQKRLHLINGQVFFDGQALQQVLSIET